MKVFNTLGRSYEPFVPRDPGRVGFYVCGPTVQAPPHLGHGRAAVAFDVVRRYLEWRGYEVTYVQNITDIDDKIINAAEERGVAIAQVADEAATAFRRAYQLLGIMAPSVEPKATEHIGEMIDMIGKLIDNGRAYEAGGDVYFSVRSYEPYGKLSGRDVDELQAGARINPDERKRDPLDFAVWKGAKPGEPSWESPWGPGRPGWHIECSAMARKYLGDGFDFHAGGIDLVFPHHENEIAQSEAANGVQFARYWLHNGMVNLSGEKMSKSTGHVVDLLGALEQYPPLAVRLFYLRTNYRRPLEFTEEALGDAAASLERLWAFRRRLPEHLEDAPQSLALEGFQSALDDDFDVAGGLAVLFDVVREGNRTLDAGADAGEWGAAYDELAGVLGILEPAADLDEIEDDVADLAAEYGVAADGPVAEVIDRLLVRRDEARAAKDWTAADEIRNRLAALRIVVEDSADGARWHRG
jgi:cysteinyl-tRNA synthetase